MSFLKKALNSNASSCSRDVKRIPTVDVPWLILSFDSNIVADIDRLASPSYRTKIHSVLPENCLDRVYQSLLRVNWKSEVMILNTVIRRLPVFSVFPRLWYYCNHSLLAYTFFLYSQGNGIVWLEQKDSKAYMFKICGPQKQGEKIATRWPGKMIFL